MSDSESTNALHPADLTSCLPPAHDIEQLVQISLQEDLGGWPGRDITAELIPESARATARLICREQAVIAGTAWFNEVFAQLGEEISISWQVNDGDVVASNALLCELTGNARALLTGERTAMNLLQTLSGTATQTQKYSEQLTGTHCRLLDTRKTLPAMRSAQKFAVLCGGGFNHRIGLFDAFLIKENHIATCGGITAAIERARQLYPELPVEVEVETLEELKEALAASCDIIMLDNFDNELKREAVAINRQQSNPAKLEASGDITIDTIRAVAETGVDYISVGALTKHLRAVDLSMRLSLDD